LEILSQRIYNFGHFPKQLEAKFIFESVLQVFRKVESVFTAAPGISTSIALGRCIPRRESRFEPRSTAGPRTKSAPRPLSAYAESGGTVVGLDTVVYLPGRQVFCDIVLSQGLAMLNWLLRLWHKTSEWTHPRPAPTTYRPSNLHGRRR
jgi:hypothetical protein